MPLSCKVIRGASVDHKGTHEVKVRSGLKRIEVSIEDAKTISEVEIRELLKQATLEAAEIRDKALVEAGNILAEAEEQAEKLKTKAYEEAFQQGYRAALEKAQKEAEKLRIEAKAVVAEANRLHAEIIGSSEKEIIGLAIRVAEKIIHHQLENNPEIVLYLTREACLPFSRSKNILIFANPADVETLRNALEHLSDDLNRHANLNILVDAGIPVGGCRVETENGQAEVTVEGKLVELKSLLLGRVEGAESAGR